VFNQTNWDVDQQVTIAAVDDSAVEGTHAASIIHTVSSTDSHYQAIAAPTLSVSILDNDGVTPIRIMPLGDSITHGVSGRASYRYDLWHAFQASACAVDFVGSQTSVGDPPAPDPNFDQDHQGHRGWRADELAVQTATWTQAAMPDVIVIHAGTNDIRQGQSNTSTIEDLRAIITNARSVISNVKFVLAQIIPAETFRDAATQDLNTRIAVLAGEMNTTQSPVILVDQFSEYTSAIDNFDSLHPNFIGEAKMARRFYDATLPFVSTCMGPVNQAPVVDAGADRSITNGSSVILVASVMDDNRTSQALAYRWRQVSGPSTGAVIATPTSISTGVSFSAVGSYVFEVYADDGPLLDWDRITVNVV
jgi:hypothetical protein